MKTAQLFRNACQSRDAYTRGIQLLETPVNVSRMPVQLRKYWITHEAWAAPGAFDACVKDLREHGVPGHEVDGACANLHHEATGQWPGHHKNAAAKYDPTQQRGEHGRWSKTGAIKKALTSLLDPEGGQGAVSLPDRDGVDSGRYVDFSSHDSNGNINFEIGSDDEITVALDFAPDELSHVANAMALSQMRHEAPPLNPGDRQSVLLHSMLAGSSDAAAFEDGRYFDWSTDDNAGNIGFEFGDSAESVRVWISPDEFAQLHASLAASLIDDEPAPQNRATRRLRGKYNPLEHRGHDGKWSDSTPGPDLGVLQKLGGVMDGDSYRKSYGDTDDEHSVHIDGLPPLTVRVFESGDAQLTFDLPDDHYQVITDLDVKAMDRLREDIDDMLAVDPDEYDAIDLKTEPDGFERGILDRGKYTDDHSLMVAADYQGDIRIGVEDDNGDAKDFMDLSRSDASSLSEALFKMQVRAEEIVDADGGDLIDLDANLKALMTAQFWAHLPGLHDQRDHGRKGKKHLPSVDVPDVVDVKPARKRVPAKKATPAPKTPAKPAPVKTAAPAKRAKPGKAIPVSPGGYTPGRDTFADGTHIALARDVYAGPDLNNWETEQSGDVMLTSISAKQGFDGKPQVVSKAQMDALIAAGHVELHRGVIGRGKRSAASIQEQYRTGSLFSGFGQFGNGTYTSTSVLQGRHYSDGTQGSLLRLGLRPGARVVDNKDLRAEYAAFRESASGVTASVYGDPSRYAAARGYDVIVRRFPSEGDGLADYIILNRTAVVVQVAG